MFEPIHGSAPKYTGKKIVNPIASIESVRMMLEHLGEAEAAESVLNAVIGTLSAGKIRTADMGGRNKTYEMGDAVKQAMLVR